MKNLSLSRFLVCCVLAEIVVGCGGTGITTSLSNTGPPLARVSQSMPELPQLPTHGGTFSGKYAGSYSFQYCTMQHTGIFGFSGNGKASFIGPGGDQGTMHNNYIRFEGCSELKGSAVLKSSRIPANFINVAIYDPGGIPCGSNVAYIVVGGGGKFANATGSGTVTFQCSGSTYSDQWSGTLSF